jgi:GTPase SAR1 family protein
MFLSQRARISLLVDFTSHHPYKVYLVMKDPTVVSRKVAVLGFRAVGKSSLTNSFISGSFSVVYDPTIESTYHKTIRFRKVHFATDIVDTAGMVNVISSVVLKYFQRNCNGV